MMTIENKKWCHTPTLSLEISEIFNIFCFLLTFIYHLETLYKPHCWQCSVKFIHAGHVILQLICWKLWRKMLLQAFQPHKLPVLTSQLHLAQRATPRYGVTPLPYL